jgi:hypothetical protein
MSAGFSKVLVSASLMAFLAVFAVFPPDMSWRPWMYTGVALLFAVGLLTNPKVAGRSGRRSRMLELAIVFIVGGSFLTLVFYVTSVSEPLVISDSLRNPRPDPPPSSSPATALAPEGSRGSAAFPGPNAARLARGWTLHKRGDHWQFYLMIDADQLDPATASEIRRLRNPVDLEQRMYPVAGTLWTELRKGVTPPKLVENALGVVSRQEVLEHINHTLGIGALTWNYEIIRDGSGITPRELKPVTFEIGSLSAEARDATDRLDALMHRLVKDLHAQTLLKVSR